MAEEAAEGAAAEADESPGMAVDEGGAASREPMARCKLGQARGGGHRSRRRRHRELSALMAAKRAKTADLAAMRERRR